MLLLKNGRVLNPATGTDEILDILICDDKVIDMAHNIEQSDCQIIDATGCFVMPGFIDLHVHLRDPGLTYKEDIKTGCNAAAKGGITTIVAMPNTKPVVDSIDTIEYIYKKAKEEGIVNVLQVGAITKGMQGQELAPIEEMVAHGICAISEDGKSVMNSALYKEAMKLAAKNNIPVLAHCEDINLVQGGVMNLDDNSRRLGLKGISNAVEDIIVARDIMLAKETGARLHLCHCSTELSVRMIKEAKADGLTISGEVCPHHFTLSSDDIKKNDSNYKMNPPLRTQNDVKALINGLKEGIMEVISTDHAPHSAEEKALPMEKAPFGIVGLETSAALTYTALVDSKVISPLDMARKMSYTPAKILGIEKGDISVGRIADIVIFNPNETYSIDSSTFVSKGHNTPYDGYPVKGRVITTIVSGKIIYEYKNN